MDKQVLILVLVEDTLRGRDFFVEGDGSWGLNPCFSGRYSASWQLSYET